MSDETRLKKNAAIAESIALTRLKRKSQACRVFKVKVQSNKLTRAQKESLAMIFVEAKWLRNDFVAKGAPRDYVIKDDVPVVAKDGSSSVRAFRFLGSQVRQSIVQQARNELRMLETRKNKGYKVGSLKFVSKVTSVDLKQSGSTYKFKTATKARIQGVPGVIRVRGSHQLKGWELANAKLLSKPDGYYLAVTCFKEVSSPAFVKDTIVGIDMGLKTHITLSDGTKINVEIGETERLKSLQRKFARQQAGSNSRRRTLALIQKEHQNINNRKDDVANKLVHELLKNETIFIQDEQISKWKKKTDFVRGGKTIQSTILGRVKSRLANHDRVVVLSKVAATTQMCVCGTKTRHHPSQREFFCGHCGYRADRDLHAAQNMIRLGVGKIPAERRKSTLVESVLDWSSHEFQLHSVKPEVSNICYLQLTSPITLSRHAVG